MRKPLVQIPTLRTVSTKHPKGFVPPTEEDLTELRESVQEFTSESPYVLSIGLTLTVILQPGREITEDVAARTDAQNEFPPEMWRKLGEAG